MKSNIFNWLKGRIFTQISITLIIIGIFLIGNFYYPKWNETKTESTLSWDVSGYYFYLPAIYIYKDLKQVKFKDEILEKYHPTPDFQQGFLHENSGNYVMKYSIGQSILMTPAFFIGHAWASSSERYPADGFSYPYQKSIGIWTLIVAMIGMIMLARILSFYFTDKTVTITIIAIFFGTNYLNYSIIDGAMTHNSLFTIYTLLIYSTIRFYKNPSYVYAIFIGLFAGIAALTRPTEIIAVIIPMAWGLRFSIESIRKKGKFIQQHIGKFILAAIVTLLIGSVQLFYWKYVSGDWIVYSYEDQGFSWLSPHFSDGIFSYKSGWLMYTPMMIFSLIGLVFLPRELKNSWLGITGFILVFMYITFAWDVWTYGGAIGQRAMIQAYPVLAFPLAAFFLWVGKRTVILKAIIGLLFIIFTYLSMWFVHQAHHGKLLHVAQMTRPYYWKVLGRYDNNRNNLKLLDGRYMYDGKITDKKVLLVEDFNDRKPTFCLQDTASSGALCLTKEMHKSDKYSVPYSENAYKWLRAEADFIIKDKEWNVWSMPMMVLELKKNGKNVYGQTIRIQRLTDPHSTKRLSVEMKTNHVDFDEIDVSFWNNNSEYEVQIDNLEIYLFNPTTDQN